MSILKVPCLGDLFSNSHRRCWTIQLCSVGLERQKRRAGAEAGAQVLVSQVPTYSFDEIIPDALVPSVTMSCLFQFILSLAGEARTLAQQWVQRWPFPLWRLRSGPFRWP